jgi:YfiH family protein
MRSRSLSLIRSLVSGSPSLPLSLRIFSNLMKNSALYSSLLLEAGVPHGFFPPGSEFLLLPGGCPIPWDRLCLPRQVHGTTILPAGEGKGKEADGLYATRPEILVGIATADCVPIILSFPSGVMVLHAGWRGIAGGIVERGVMILLNRFGVDPEEILVALGPSAGGCCYQVGPEVAKALGLGHERTFVDLRDLIVGRLTKLGVKRVERVGPCTICSGPPWASYRREGRKAQRNLAIAGYL